MRARLFAAVPDPVVTRLADDLMRAVSAGPRDDGLFPRLAFTIDDTARITEETLDGVVHYGRDPWLRVLRRRALRRSAAGQAFSLRRIDSMGVSTDLETCLYSICEERRTTELGTIARRVSFSVNARRLRGGEKITRVVVADPDVGMSLFAD